MFLGEILAIDVFISLPGIAFMSYIVSNLAKTSFYSNQFVFNPLVVAISVAIVFGFHLIIGLLPVFNTLRKTPAEILSGNAID